MMKIVERERRGGGLIEREKGRNIEKKKPEKRFSWQLLSRNGIANQRLYGRCDIRYYGGVIFEKKKKKSLCISCAPVIVT